MLIRQKAFECTDKVQKVALHTHTNRSDGRLEPKELLEAYAEAGFDLVAITDHSIYNKVNYAPELGVLVIPGIELEAAFDRDKSGARHLHTVALGPNDDTNGFMHDQVTPYDNYLSSHKDFQALLDLAHKNNNITFYCHPEWSRTPARIFEELEGNFAYEIWNTGSALGSDVDCNGAYWEELYDSGHRLFGVATDDAHGRGGVGHGYVMVSAEKNVRAVLDALRSGAFYSTRGPIIKDFSYDTESGTAYVLADRAEKIYLVREKNWNVKFKLSEKDGMVAGEYKMSSRPKLLRAVVVDKDGLRAWTNPIYVD